MEISLGASRTRARARARDGRGLKKEGETLGTRQACLEI